MTIAMAGALFERSARAGDLLVRTPSCERPVLDYQEMMAGLALELASDGLVPRASSAPASAADAELILDMPCVADADYVELRARTTDGKRSSRRMALADLPLYSRARGIAVVGAEIVRSAMSSEVPAAPDEPPIEVPSIRARETPRPLAPATPEPSFRLQASAEARMFVGGSTFLFGGALGMQAGRVRPALHLLRGGERHALGDIAITLAAASVGVDLWRWERSRVSLALGPRIGAGILFADATAVSNAFSKRAREPYFDGAIEFASRLRLQHSWWLTVAIAAGYARGMVVVADGGVAARPEGPFTGLGVGLALAP